MPNLYDNTPLELEEIVDHCRALSSLKGISSV